MSDITERIIPSGRGIDTDSDILAIGEGRSRYRLNVIEKDGDLGALVNTQGNTQITFALPSGDNSVIGQVEDEENATSIAFIYNSNSSHSIVAWDPSNNTAWYILDGTDDSGDVGVLLNFQLDNYVDAGIIGNQDDRYLVWTDGYNEPRMINITMARNYTAGSGTPIYSSMTEDIIRFYKKPYLNDIDVSYNATGEFVNNLRGKVWQFAIRKKFYDKTYSVLSPPSEVIIPNEEEKASGLFLSNSKKNSELFIVIYDSDDDDIVDEYQLCYRILDIGSGVNSSWYLTDTPWTTQPGGRLTKFYNNQTGIILADTDRFYDYVPDLADHVFAIDSNRVVFGGITEGYDNIPESDLDVTLSTSRIGNLNDGFVDSLFFNEVITDTSTSSSIDTTKTSPQEYQYVVTIVDSVTNDHYYAKYVDAFGVTGDVVALDLKTQIDAISGLSASNSASSFTVTNNLGNTARVSMYVLDFNTKYSSFKCGTDNFFGLQYYKDGKPWFVQKSEDFKISIPYQYEAPNDTEASGTHTGSDNVAILTDGTKSFEVNELVGAAVYNTTDGSNGLITANTATTITAALTGGTDDDWDTGDAYTVSFDAFNFYNQVDWELDHLPPDGATHYQWMYLGSNVDYYEYYYCYADRHITYDGNYTLISKNISSDFKEAYDDTINYGFDVQKGDRVRFIGLAASPTTLIGLYDELYDFEVLDVDATDIKIKNIEQLMDSTLSISIIEIYRPREINENSGIYQTVSPVLEIYDDGGTMRHRGIDQDQTSSLPATGEFNPYYADCFVFSASYVNENNSETIGGADFFVSFMESYSVSLLYDSRIDSYGKQNIVNEFARRAYINKIRFGGKYLDNSGVNFISKFDFDDERFVDDKYGLITKMQQAGNTLKVYQERDVTSFYLGATYATDPDGNEITAFAGTVMSEARKSQTEYGCTYFTGFVRTPEVSYFLDVRKSVVLRDSPGGIIPINGDSDQYFKEKCQDILSSSDDIVALMGWDNRKRILYLTFLNKTTESLFSETFAYYEDGDYWMSFYSFIPEMYGKAAGSYFLSFKDGDCWIHNVSSTYNNFYGDQYASQVWLHANKNAGANKVYDAMEISSVGQWSCPTNGDISIEKPIVMSSRLKSGKFKLQEGLYRSEFLKDMNTTGSAVVDDLFNGRELRGHEVTIKLHNSDTTKAELNYVDVSSSISK